MTRLALTTPLLAVLACSPRESPVNDLGEPDSFIQTNCMQGTAFVACPGPAAPAIYCSRQRCKWISTGLPVGDLLSKADTACNCAGPSCPDSRVIENFIHDRGTQPWTRERDLVVSVTVDPAIGPGATTFTCANCTGACAPGNSPCSTSIGGVLTRDCPGTCSFLLGEMGGLFGWRLEIEVDYGYMPRKARACIIPFTDVSDGCRAGTPAPTCATSGTLAIDHAGNTATAGIFDLNFQSGLNIKGTFPAR